MNNLKILKVGTAFILEAISFTHSKNIEKSAPSIQWTITPEGGSAENIGTGKALNYTISKKYAGKKVTFRAYIKEDSNKRHPKQCLTCFIEKQVSVAGVLIKEVTGATKAEVGDTVEYKVSKYNIGANKVTAAQKKQIKWDWKIEGEEKKILVDEYNNLYLGETIRVTVPEAWAGKNVTLMPYMNQSSEKTSTKINIASLEENIIIIGTQQHNSSKLANILRRDVGINSKLMFVHQALRRVVLNKELPWTILFCAEGYTQMQQERIKKAFKAAADFLKEFVLVSSNQDIVNYINTKDVNGKKAIRSSGQVRRILFYSHGIVKEILPWMGAWADGDSFNIEKAEKMNSSVFTKDALIYSFACRTGLGNTAIGATVYKNEKKVERYNLLSAESLAQKMANATHATVHAYLKRTWYGNTLFTDDEYDFMDAIDSNKSKKAPKRDKVKAGEKYSSILKSGANSQELKRFNELYKIRKELELIDGATFLPRGALNPVSAAETPEGLPDDMKTYKKM